MKYAKSGDENFIQQIEQSAFYGIVHSIFARVINIYCVNTDELFSLACNKVDNGPNTLVIGISEFVGTSVQVNDNVFVKNGILFIEDKESISIEYVKKWIGTLPSYPDDSAKLMLNLIKMKKYIHAHGVSGGIKRSVLSNNIFENEMSKILEEQSNGLVRALANHDFPEALQCATKLIGLGPGLTPSGDDFIVGLLTVFNIPDSPCYTYRAFGFDLVKVAKKLTNDVSFIALKKSSTGMVRQTIIRLLHSLMDGEEKEMIHALDNVLNIGSSSGTDIALGIVCGLEMNMETGGRVCLQDV